MNQVALSSSQPMMTFDQSKVDLLRNTICRGSSPQEFELFLHACKRTGLDPFMRQIFAVKYGGQMSIQTGIDGYRLIAERTGKYSPGREPTYQYDENGKLISATAYVKKQTQDGTWHEVAATAFFDEYCPKTKDGKPTRFWLQMGHAMLSKCLPYRAVIETNLGSFPIGEIVNKRLPVLVRSINLNTGLEEWKPVTDWIKNPGTSDWTKIIVPGNRRGSNSIITTPDHLIYTEKGWIEASLISPGDKIGVSSSVASKDQFQVIIGSLMGDGHLYIKKGRKKTSCPMYTECHSEKQRDYLLWKFKNLINFNPKLVFYDTKVKGSNHNVIKLYTSTSPYFYDLHHKFYSSDKKNIEVEILDKLDDLGVSVWIMDDGCVRKTGNGDSCRPYLRLYTCCFEEQELFVEFFQRKYQITPSIFRTEKNPYLSFGVEETEILLNRLSKYIKFNRDKNTKEWIAQDIEIGPKNSFCFVPCLENISFKSRGRSSTDRKPKKEGRYDITVQDNHNFIYNNVIVHNCAEALALRKAFPGDLSGLYTKEEMQQAEAEVVESPEIQEAPKVRNKPQTISKDQWVELMQMIEKCKQDYQEKMWDFLTSQEIDAFEKMDVKLYEKIRKSCVAHLATKEEHAVSPS